MASTLDIPPAVQESLKAFRFRKATSNAAIIFKINQKELVVEEQDTVDFDTVEDLVDELPSNSPRYVVCSMTVRHADGRSSTPLFLLNWIPSSSAPAATTLHASGLSLFQITADVARVIEIRDEADLTSSAVEAQLL